MATIEFSERLFEFALNRELYERYGNIYIPTQIKESQLGFDARFRLHKKNPQLPNILATRIKFLCIQHKRPHKVYHRSKNSFLTSCSQKLNNILPSPRIWSSSYVFSFKIKPNKKGVFNQHIKLKRISGRRFALAFYAAPRFYKVSTLYKLMRNNRVINETAFIDLNLLGNATKIKGSHYVYYDEHNNTNMVMCSEPHHIYNADLSFEKITEMLTETNYVSLDELLKLIQDDENMDVFLDKFDSREDFYVYDVIDYIASKLFKNFNGSSFVLIDK